MKRKSIPKIISNPYDPSKEIDLTWIMEMYANNIDKMVELAINPDDIIGIEIAFAIIDEMEQYAFRIRDNIKGCYFDEPDIIKNKLILNLNDINADLRDEYSKVIKKCLDVYYKDP